MNQRPRRVRLVAAVAALTGSHCHFHGGGFCNRVLHAPRFKFLKAIRMFVLSALLSGLVFGLGLIVSGMANPAKVLGFLDLTGEWDPSLALVMAGAIAVGFFAFLIAKNRKRSFIGAEMKLPTTSSIDNRLLAGSALFGAGWGIAGFCPGPGLVALGMGEPKAIVFVAAMLAGMVIFSWLEKRKSPAVVNPANAA